MKAAHQLVFTLVTLASAWDLSGEDRTNLYNAFRNVLDEMPGSTMMLTSTFNKEPARC
jgi:hypothetical protein